MKMDTKLRGGEALRRALRRRGELRGLETVLQSLGDDLRALAEDNLEQSGLPEALVRQLKNSLRQTVEADGTQVLGSEDPLASRVENGTLRYDSQPWLLPALMDMQRQARDRLRALLKG